MDKTEIGKLVTKLINEHMDNKQPEVKENNKSIRDYTKAEMMVFDIAERNLDVLETALKNAIYSENNCAQIIKEVQPVGDDFDKYYRIVEIISRYDGAWKSSKYQGKAPKTKRSLTDRIKPVNELK